MSAGVAGARGRGGRGRTQFPVPERLSFKSAGTFYVLSPDIYSETPGRGCSARCSPFASVTSRGSTVSARTDGTCFAPFCSVPALARYESADRPRVSTPRYPLHASNTRRPFPRLCSRFNRSPCPVYFLRALFPGGFQRYAR